ncbi:MAG: hypothetical protein HKN16_09645 [Saprospiraceae bacterium]|nr:hypothetical protein [Saprospiraceae bacterium]
MFLRIVIGFLVLSFMSCAPVQDSKPLTASLNPEPNSKPTRNSLIRKQFDINEILVAYSGDDAEQQKAWKEFFEEVGGDTYRNIKLNFIPADEVSKEDHLNTPVLIVGTFSQNVLLRTYEKKLPFKVGDNIIQFAGKKFSDPHAVLQISTFPNPNNPTIPIYVCTGISEEAIRNHIKLKLNDDWGRMLWDAFSYQVYQADVCRMRGAFSKDDWTIDKKVHWEFDPKNQTHESHDLFNFVLHPPVISKTSYEILKQQCFENAARVTEFTRERPKERIEYHVYPSLEEKGLMLFNTDHAHNNSEKGQVHSIHHPAYSGNHSGLENELILEKTIGEPLHPAMQQGLAIQFSDSWMKRGWQYWASLLFNSGNLPRLQDLFNEEYEEFESPLIIGAGRASYVAFLLDHWGRKKFLSEYHLHLPGKDQKLESKWRTFLTKLPKEKISQRNSSLPGLKGFNFAHEGYGIYNGYGSRLAEESLQRMVGLGSNAVAIVPYTYMPDPEKPSPLFLRHRPGAETDESVTQSIFHAKQLGCYVMLKPQVWMGRDWTGIVEMTSQDDWDKFFDHYYRWIRHYALLAELNDVEALSVGVEFVKASLINEERWVEMFQKIRLLYSGHLTYSANWGEEFENVGFWKHLDYIGLNCYYPLSKSPTANPRKLRAGVQQIIQSVEKIAYKYGKPIVLTEVGFRSVESPWILPYAEADGRNYNGAHQALCYDILCDAFSKKDWCSGILWWKWPSYDHYGGPENSSFTPLGKPAEKVVKEMFTRH